MTDFVAALLTIALAASDVPSAAPESDRQAIRESKFELFVTDPDESLDFYRALGFDVAHRQPYGYTTLTSGDTVIALSPVPWWVPLRLASWLRYPPIGSEIVLYVDDLAGARRALVAADYEPGAIALQSWGDRDFRITDPDGYYLRISEGGSVPAPDPSTAD